eukprot:Gb_25396 [translate_table: standard]
MADSDSSWKLSNGIGKPNLQQNKNNEGLLLANCSIIEIGDGTVPPVIKKGKHILIQNKRIQYIGPTPLIPQEMVDVGGRFVLPGLCDAHVHVLSVVTNSRQLSELHPSLIIAKAIKLLEFMLLRGFTTVRDCGGCDCGLAQAVDDGTVLGPRVLFCGHALTPTGGYGDNRLPGEVHDFPPYSISLHRVCDGVTAVRKAAREELRKGAHHVKLMTSGGPNTFANLQCKLQFVDEYLNYICRIQIKDHVHVMYLVVFDDQFSEEEIVTALEEASNCGKYVSAHAYTPAAVKRALELGVRSIEHGNCIDDECCSMMKERGTFFVPTLVSYDCCHRFGAAFGMEPSMVAKLMNTVQTGWLLNEGKRGLNMADSKGVKVCFGSDLPGGDLHDYQLEEFLLRSSVLKPDALLRSATTSCAELFQMEGEIGVISEGAFGDILVLEKNPLEDISVLADSNNMRMILKEGRIVKAKNLKARLEDGGQRIIRYFED